MSRGPAGPAAGELGAGEAIAISTGAVTPVGCDAIVRVEDTDTGQVAADGPLGKEGDSGTEVEIRVGVEPGRNVRRAGDDIVVGAKVLEAGTRLGPAQLGVLASIGVGAPECVRMPRLGVLSTGDELIGPSDALFAGAVRNSNAIALPALARACGATIVDLPRVADDPEATREAIGAALEAVDVLVLSGGVSVGPHDHVKPALEQLGVEEVFWGVSLKPGKPTLFSTIADKLVFGLPGIRSRPSSPSCCSCARPCLLCRATTPAQRGSGRRRRSPPPTRSRPTVPTRSGPARARP